MEILKAAIAAVDAGRPCALVTVVGTRGSSPREAGSRMLVFADGSSQGTVGGGAVEHAAIQQAREVIEAGTPRRLAPDLASLGMACGGAMDLFIEPLIAPPRLVIFGAGHVAAAVSPIAGLLGFERTVIDPRPELATAERFPGCTVQVAPHLASAEGLATHSRTWILVVTHGHGQDLEVLRALIARPWAWLGVIASRRKIATFLQELRSEGVPEEHLERVSSPVGLDIGAQTPAEIAVSIAAEWVQHRHGLHGAAPPLTAGRPDRRA
ncbi:MAG: XdhC family protein [Pseudomonadota bacterium]